MFLLCFSRGNILTPYSKSVPAVIAKASAIYNPIIYAIIHPRYRYSKYIDICITVHANMDLLHRANDPFSFSLTLCSAVPVLTGPWGALGSQTQLLHGSSRYGLGSARREQSLPSPFLSLRALLCPLELHNTVTDRRRRWCSGHLSLYQRQPPQSTLDKRSQPVKLKKSHPYQFKQLYMHIFKAWFSEAFFSQKKLKHCLQKLLNYIKGMYF